MKKEIRWFSPHELLTRNKLFNFVIGTRGGGKSFGTLRFCVDRFIKTGETFIYLRREQVELDDSMPTLFNEMISAGYFAEHELKTHGNRMYCDGKVMGYGVALSTSMKRKSVAYADVAWVIFEEFMVDGVTGRYLGRGDSEVKLFLNFYETVARMHDKQPRVFFIANAFSTVNIYFTFFNIKLTEPYKRYMDVGEHILVCIWSDDSYMEAKKETAFYKLVQGTDFAKHAYENKFLLDRDHFIRKQKPQNHDFNFALAYMEKTYGVYTDFAGSYWISEKRGNAGSDNTVSLTLEDNRPNNINIRRVRNMPAVKMFRNAVDMNQVYYDKLETYQALHEAVYLLRTIT